MTRAAAQAGGGGALLPPPAPPLAAEPSLGEGVTAVEVAATLPAPHQRPASAASTAGAAGESSAASLSFMPAAAKAAGHPGGSGSLIWDASAGSDVPLLVPLVRGAATNMTLDMPYDEAQVALIERYLQLVGPPPPPQPPQRPPSATPSPRNGSSAGGGGAGGGGGGGGAAAAAVTPADDPAGGGPAMRALHIDRAALAARGVPSPLITTMHSSLAAAAAAFFRTCLAERRRLAALAGGSGSAVTMGDRLLAFLSGSESQLQTGSALPHVDELRHAKDVEELLHAVVVPLTPRPASAKSTATAVTATTSAAASASQQLLPTPLPSRGTTPRSSAAQQAYEEGGAERQEEQPAGQEQSLPAPQQQEARQAQAQEQAAPHAGAMIPLVDGIPPPAPPPQAPYHHELMHLRQLPPPPPPSPPPPSGVPDVDELLEGDKPSMLAAAGNIAGMRALLHQLTGALAYCRTQLRGRAEEEGRRAQRESVTLAEARAEAAKLRRQLAARERVLADRGAELQAACVRAAEAVAAMEAERSAAGVLRAELRALEAEQAEHTRQLKAKLEEHMAELRKSLPAGGDLQAAASQLSAARSELALTEMRCQQERAVAGQLRVMLASTRAALQLHVTRAAKATEEAERLGRLVAAAEDLANARTNGASMLQLQLEAERAAHRRTAERLQSVGWKVESARTAVVDIRARASHGMRRLQEKLGETQLRAVGAERQVADLTIALRDAMRRLEDTTNDLEAVRDRSLRVECEMETMRQRTVALSLDAQEAEVALRGARGSLAAAEARVEQLQKQIVDGANDVLAGREAAKRMEELEAELSELRATHAALQDTHGALAAAHAGVVAELGDMRTRLTELERADVMLVEALARLEKLHAEHEELNAKLADVTRTLAEATAQLAATRTHRDALAEQVQEARRDAERAAMDLEAEKVLHRRTQGELDINVVAKKELQKRVAQLEEQHTQMSATTSAATTEAARCRRALELAEAQRAEAFAMRDSWLRVRLLMSADVREYLKSMEEQVALLGGCLQAMRGGLTAVAARLLDVPPGVLEGSGVAAPVVPYEEVQKLSDALFGMVSHASQLLGAQTAAREALSGELQRMEEGVAARLATATDYWRQVLSLTRGSPRAMVQMVERMTGQICKELELDPNNPLGRMIPIGVFEETASELGGQHERLGGLQSSAHVAQAAAHAAAQLLEHERLVTAAREAEFRSLLSAMSGELGKLKARVGGLEANNAMQQRATADMQRMLMDAEWKVAKALEREALSGIKNMVPRGRETKAVQTVFNDMYMLLPPSQQQLQSQPSQYSQQLQSQPSARSVRSVRPKSRPTSGRAAAVAEALAAAAEAAEAAEAETHDRWASGSLSESGGSPLRGAEAATAAAAAAGTPSGRGWSAGQVPDTPLSPASLPPLSLLNSPTTSGLSALAAAVAAVTSPRPLTSPGPYSVVSRPQSNLSRAPHVSYAQPLAPPPPPPLSPPPSPPVAAVASSAPAAAGAQGDGSRPASRPTSAASVGGGQVSLVSILTGVHRSRSSPNSPRTRLVSAAAGSGAQPRVAAATAGGGGGGGGGAPHHPHHHHHHHSAQHASRRRHPDPAARTSWAPSVRGPPMDGEEEETAGVAARSAARPTSAGSAGGGDAAAAAAAAVRSYASGYTSDGSAVGGDGDVSGSGSEYDRSDDGEGEDAEGEGEGASPPRELLRTPSASATAAAAAAFARAHSFAAPSAGPASAPSSPPRTPPYTSSGAAPPSAAASAAALHAAPAPAPAPAAAAAAPAPANAAATPSGIPHGWQASAWNWVDDAAPLARGAAAYSRQQLLELVSDIYHTKSLHDQVAAAASFPPTSMLHFVGAYFEARHGPRGSAPPATELALAQLLVSLEAHSALYDVMLFARVAGLQAWTGKALQRGPAGGASSRPSTARPSTPASNGPLSSSGALPGLPARPRTSRPSALSPYSPSGGHSESGGGGGGGVFFASPRSPAGAGAAAARSNRAMSARVTLGPHGYGPLAQGPGAAGGSGTRSSGVGVGAGGAGASGPPPGLPTRPLSPEGPDADPYGYMHGSRTPSAAAAWPAPASPASASLARRSGAAAAYGPLGAAAPPPPRLRLRVPGEVMLTEALAGLLVGLRDVAGMEALARFVSAGRLAGRLRQADLGQPLPEPQHPELHFLVGQVSAALGLEDPPELLVRQEGLPYAADVMLLQLPNVGIASLGILASGDADRQPPNMGANGQGSAAPPGGWRRRAVLLLSPQLVAAAAAAAAGPLGSSGGAGPAAAAPMSAEELMAALGAALGPIVMPGGAGWRLDVHAPGPASPTRVGGLSAVGPAPDGPAAATAAAAPTLLSAAEVVTAVNIAALKPRAAMAALPSQLQVKWERLLAHLRTVAGAAAAAADRGALLAAQAVAPAVRAVFRAAAGASLAAAAGAGAVAAESSSAAGSGLDGGRSGSGAAADAVVAASEELLLAAGAMPWGAEEAAALATMPAQEAAAAVAERRRAHALARVAAVARWAESASYRSMLRAAVM